MLESVKFKNYMSVLYDGNFTSKELNEEIQKFAYLDELPILDKSFKDGWVWSASWSDGSIIFYIKKDNEEIQSFADHASKFLALQDYIENENDSQYGEIVIS